MTELSIGKGSCDDMPHVGQLEDPKLFSYSSRGWASEMEGLGSGVGGQGHSFQATAW